MTPDRLEVGITCSGYFFGLETVRAVEELGYDRFWTAEHITFHRPIQDVVPVLSAAAAVTRRIGLGAAVILLPLHHPVVLAKSLSTLDALSGGRLTVGIGVGGENPHEFEACGVDLRTRGARADEAMEVMRDLWKGSRSSHRGRFWQFDDALMLPPPTQPGGPPLWVAGRSEAAMRRAANRGDGYLPYLVSPDSFAQRVGRLQVMAAQEGRTLPDSYGLGVRLELSLDDREDRAAAKAAAFLTDRFETGFTEDQARRYALCGPAEVVLAQIDRWRQAGLNTLVMQPVSDPGDERAVLARFAREVLPHLHRRSAEPIAP
ncbi:MAG: LLM class flavin-dependent oxidoreductase [Candidatus Dormibacteraeota bacterium]|uniref:LLM class flavin-dependent oxidoreductase n=2 Tax=Candidatus Dormibacteria TaxID=3126996 RepID=A0A934K190_9BACT|nr:LLM class flavin-dependent oxidoreductase [Candidatus Dormibacteraeota bacterium]MBJ7603946.1 LLM class flavin-dependent oxidoreductase [Candidatus Dormibacteraeota bacterium]MBJ7607175.1 LLM class flavin-dependent oxidoreductase [Candidatus Dormibacteraeota bacterium]